MANSTSAWRASGTESGTAGYEYTNDWGSTNVTSSDAAYPVAPVRNRDCAEAYAAARRGPGARRGLGARGEAPAPRQSRRSSGAGASAAEHEPAGDGADEA